MKRLNAVTLLGMALMLGACEGSDDNAQTYGANPALPEPQRSLLVMFDVQGHDGATCARVLGLNVNQVKVYLHRARRRLREQMERQS